MKKLGVIVLFSLLLVSSFVSAQQILGPLAQGAADFYNSVFEPFGKFLLGANTNDGELFFAKLLFFIVLITLVNYALSQFPPLQGKSWIVSAIVSILAVRWITPEWIETIVLPYTALGITFTAFFPFILYFFFVEKGLEGHTTMRKVAWIFAGVVFIGLFVYRDASQFANYSSNSFNPAYIYLIAGALSFAMLWFDNTIQRAFGKARNARRMDKQKYSVDYDTLVEYDKIMTNYYNSSDPDSIKAGSNQRIGALNNKRKSKGLAEFDIIK